MDERPSLKKKSSKEADNNIILIDSYGKMTFGEDFKLNLENNNPNSNSLNDETKAYLSQISELKEIINTLKNEKFELYEEKTAEIRELRQQLNKSYIRNSLDSTSASKISSNNRKDIEDKNRISELEVLVKNKQVMILINEI